MNFEVSMTDKYNNDAWYVAVDIVVEIEYYYQYYISMMLQKGPATDWNLWTPPSSSFEKKPLNSYYELKAIGVKYFKNYNKRSEHFSNFFAR